MFETGFCDSVTIKRETHGTDINHNKTSTWTTILSGVKGELYYALKREVDMKTGVIVRVIEKLFIQSDVSVRSKDVAIINGDYFDIRQVLKRKGFGGTHYELSLERRSHID